MPNDALPAESAIFNVAGFTTSEAAPAAPETDAMPEFTIEDAASETDDAAVVRLAALPVLEYERQRTAEAERMGVRACILDKLVEAVRRVSAGSAFLQGRPLTLEAPEPWPDPVDGAELLNGLAAFFARHATLPVNGADALALWSLHTHCYQAARHTPRLAITSAEKGSGKTTILDLLELTCCRPLAASNLTAAAIFRAVEAAKPTLLVDEADLFLAEAPDVRAVLNAGNKHGGQVVRCVGDDAEPRSFTVHAPVAVAAIGRLPDTLADRSIRLSMRRATATERPEPIRKATETEGRALARRIARWVADHVGHLAEEPAMPDALANRAADNWRILFAIAARAGGDWPSRATAAALAEAGGEAPESLGVALLRDVRTIFAEAGATRLPTADLVRLLAGMEDRPWPELPGTGRPITATWFTRRVKLFGAERTRWRVPGGSATDMPWGFTLDAFADAFARYLAPDGPPPPGESGNSGNMQDISANFPKSEVGTPESCSHFGLTENPAKSTMFPRSHFHPGGGADDGATSRPNGTWQGEL